MTPGRGPGPPDTPRDIPAREETGGANVITDVSGVRSMKVLVDVLDQNWGFRVSYPVEEGAAVASIVETARQALRDALQDGHIHKDEEKFCRMRLRHAPEDL